MWTIVQFCFYASLLLRFWEILLCFEKYQSAPSILCFYASKFLRFPEKMTLCFYDSSLLCIYASKKNFPRKIILCFYASCKNFPQKLISVLCLYASSLPCFYAPSLLRFWKIFPEKNQPLLVSIFASTLLSNFPNKYHPLLLSFFASMLLEQFSQQKSSFASTLLRF